MTSIQVGAADEALDTRLNEELGAFNTAAMAHAGPERELTVRIEDGIGLAAGISGWTWGIAAGIALAWVREDRRGAGLGGQLLDSFEAEARERGAHHVIVTSFTFQAPGFYERNGYVEFARWRGVPVEDHDDVHLRKELGPGAR